MASPCTTNLTTWTISVGTGVRVQASIFTQLQTAINRENTRRGLAADSFTTTSTGIKIDDTMLTQLYSNIAQFKTMTWTQAYSTAIQGTTVKAAQINELRTNINDCENDCTCDCNYCTCNCNYCTCNCNYACTCNCNYSDIRLKTNIKYF